MPDFGDVFGNYSGDGPMPIGAFGPGNAVNNFLNSKGLPTLGLPNASAPNPFKLPLSNTAGAGSPASTGGTPNASPVAANGVNPDAGSKQPAGVIGSAGNLGAYFTRAVVVILGFVFVAAGLSMFKGTAVAVIRSAAR